jgi:hypothetical protein
MKKPKKHILSFEPEYDYEMWGICSHHRDYRLVWNINDKLNLNLEKADEDFHTTDKKGSIQSSHSLYSFTDEESSISYYLIKNKNLSKYLIPEQPTIDYFLFIQNDVLEASKGINQMLNNIPSVLGVYQFDPEEFDSTEMLVFN